MNEWQPIKTAPKDGKQILMRFVGNKLYVTGVYWRGGCFIQVSDHSPVEIKTATHWMHLPEPPK